LILYNRIGDGIRIKLLFEVGSEPDFSNTFHISWSRPITKAIEYE